MDSPSNWIRGPTIGRGASATVSLAVDSASGEMFAVKSTEMSNSALLQKEQRFLSAINSPHVVSYLGFDVTAENGRSFYNLFMEYAVGGSVADEIQRRGSGGLEEWKIRSYTRGILMGISHLHSVGIVHCDVKGMNVLVGSDGATKIADLGCAKWITDDVSGDRRLIISGTPAFMAPEVTRGEEQGLASDIWALGCTVIEMATGKLPWSEVNSPIAVVHRIGFSNKLPEFPKLLSEEGRDFLDKCLRRDPGERWTADRLLSHSFLSELSPKDPIWRSPKCILDQDIWDSMDDEEEKEEEKPFTAATRSNPADRIRQLGGGSSSSTWEDEDWITVRGGDECRSSTSVNNKEKEGESNWSNSAEFSGTGGDSVDLNVEDIKTCNVVVQRRNYRDVRQMSHVVDPVITLINNINRCSCSYYYEFSDFSKTQVINGSLRSLFHTQRTTYKISHFPFPIYFKYKLVALV